MRAGADRAGRRARRDLQVRRAFGVSVAASAAWLCSQAHLGGLKWLTLVAVVACHLWCVLLERRHPTLTRTSVLAAVVGLGLLAVVLPPYGSKDIWSYAMYGRMLGVHHVSPYTHVPADFRHDLLFSRVDRLWRATPSVYGPLFNAVSAIGAVWYGSSPLRARLFYQAMAGASLVAVAMLLLRRRVATWIVILVALAPGVLAAVNAAHLDLVVGLALLGALLLLLDRRYVAAGVVLAVAALLKIVALPAIIGVLVALVIAKRWRPALRVGGVVAALVGVGYVVAGGGVAIHPDQHGAKYISHASLVNGIHELHQLAHVGPWPWVTSALARSALALVLAAVAFGTFVWRHRRTPDPATFAVAAMAIYLLTANYVLPWYAVAAIPMAALVGSRLRWCAVSTLVLLQFAYIKANHAYVPAPLLVAHVAPIVEVALLVLVVWKTEPKPAEPERSPSTTTLADGR